MKTDCSEPQVLMAETLRSGAGSVPSATPASRRSW